jgi:cytokinin dehydrogenase
MTSRRNAVQKLVAGATVVGFDSVARAWVASESESAGLGRLPPFDGELTIDPAALAAASEDFGRIIHRTPLAVLYPGSVDDIVKMAQFARAHGLKIASRGQGHTAFGQAQVDAGVVIDMSSLRQIHSICPAYAVVDAGVKWRDLLIETTPIGLTPPVLTDFTDLTVGGTLAVGGIGGTSYRDGAQVDNVLELEVVTGEGRLLTCSSAENRDLFEAMLAGLGLCGIIVRATIRLIPAKERARTFRFFYPDVTSVLGDLRVLISEGRSDHVRGQATPGPDGFQFFIEATSFYTPPEDPSADELLTGLGHIPGSTQIEDQTYFDYCDVVVRVMNQFKELGLFYLPHPWLDLFVPGSAMDAFASQTLASITPAELTPSSLILLYAFPSSRITRPMLRVPDEDLVFLFDLLLAAPADLEVLSAMVQQNRVLYDQNRDLGGTHYTISAVELSHQDWKRHFQPVWGSLVSAKHRYDPDNVLGPGPGVFG